MPVSVSSTLREGGAVPEAATARPASENAATPHDEFAEAAIQLRVGRKIRELRLASRLKAVDLAARAGISQSQLSKIETGKATLSIKVLARICKSLDRPMSYLFQSDREVPRSFGVAGTLITVDGPESAGVHKFLEEVTRASGGRLSFMPLKARQAGSAAEQVAELREGLIDIFIESLAVYQHIAPALRILSIPYSFSDDAHLHRFLGSDAFAAHVVRPLREAGIRLVNTRWNWRRGLEWALAANRPVMEPRDLAGLRVRVPDAEIQARVWDALGATPVEIPWPDVKAALAHGEIDAVATHRAHLYPLGFCKHARYVTLLGDIAPVLAVGANEARFQALPPEMQACLSAACDRAGDAFTRIVRDAEDANEPLNAARFGAVYIRVPLEPWRERVSAARAAVIADGVVPIEIWREIERIERSGG